MEDNMELFPIWLDMADSLEILWDAMGEVWSSGYTTREEEFKPQFLTVLVAQWLDSDLIKSYVLHTWRGEFIGEARDLGQSMSDGFQLFFEWRIEIGAISAGMYKSPHTE